MGEAPTHNETQAYTQRNTSLHTTKHKPAHNRTQVLFRTLKFETRTFCVSNTVCLEHKTQRNTVFVSTLRYVFLLLMVQPKHNETQSKHKKHKPTHN